MADPVSHDQNFKNLIVDYPREALAHYCLDLASMLRTARVVPVVVFLRSGSVQGPLVLGTERRAYLTFDYLACALGDMSAERWLESDNVVARINLPNMRTPAALRLDVYASAVRGLLDLEPDPDRRAKYIDFIDIYAGLTDNERRLYRQTHPEESSMMVGFNQQARDEGVRQGLSQGLSQGRVEGVRAVLVRQLKRRFGPLPSTVGARLSDASTAELEAWADNVLDAATLDEVFDPGAR